MIRHEAGATSLHLEVPIHEPLSKLVTMLVARLALPCADPCHRPLHYRLRPVSGAAFLPAQQSLSDLGVVPGTHLVLVAGPEPGQSPRPRPRRWKRRRVITAMIAILSGGAGLAAGTFTARGGASLFSQPKPAAPTAAAPVRTTAPPAVPPTRADLQLTFTGHAQVVRALTWSADSTLLASGADDAQLLIWRRQGPVLQAIPQAGPVRALAWAPDGRQLACATGTGISFLAPLSGTLLASFAHAHAGAINALAWSAHGLARLVSGGDDMVAVVWNTALHLPQLVFKGHTAAIEGATWAADGQTIGTSSLGGVVRVWNAANGQQIHGYFSDQGIALRAVAFAPTGTTLAAGGDDGRLRFWNGLVCQVQDPAGVRCLDAPPEVSANHGAVRALAWAPAARLLAAGADDGVVGIWSPSQLNAPLLTIHLGTPVHALAWSPDEQQLGVAAGNAVTLWSLR